MAWLISLFLTGLLVGVIARFLVPSPQRLGCIGTAGLGVIGSLVGGTIFNALRGGGTEIQSGGFLASVIGAVLVLVLARLVARP